MASAAVGEEKYLPFIPSNAPVVRADSGKPITFVENFPRSYFTSVKNRICGYTSVTFGIFDSSWRTPSSRALACSGAPFVLGGGPGRSEPPIQRMARREVT